MVPNFLVPAMSSASLPLAGPAAGTGQGHEPTAHHVEVAAESRSFSTLFQSVKADLQAFPAARVVLSGVIHIIDRVILPEISSPGVSPCLFPDTHSSGGTHP